MEKWTDELKLLAEFAETQPQAAHAVYTKGYRSKFTFFLRTIEGMEEHLHPVESVLGNKLIPAMFGGDHPDVPDELLALNPKDGGLGIESPLSIATDQYSASKFKTQIHTETIINQECVMRDETSNAMSSKEISEQDRQERIARVEGNKESNK